MGTWQEATPIKAPDPPGDKPSLHLVADRPDKVDNAITWMSAPEKSGEKVVPPNSAMTSIRLSSAPEESGGTKWIVSGSMAG